MMIAPQHSNDEIRQAFARRVPEVASGVLEFRKTARVPGRMTYVAVAAPASVQDPIGLLVGTRGVHIKAVVADLGGELVNLVRWAAEPTKFIGHALGLTRAGLPFQPSYRFETSQRHVYVTVDRNTEAYFVSGEGLRLRLVSELVGWSITLLSHDKPPDA
jgi:N utilization substance protein A